MHSNNIRDGKLTSGFVPYTINQVAAEIDVGHNRSVLEMRAHVAISVGEICSSSAPSSRLRFLSRDVFGNGITSKLPHSDTLFTPLNGHNASAILVEVCTKGILFAINTTTGIAVGVLIAVLVDGRAGHFAFNSHGAVFGSMEGHLIAVVGLVSGFHDVDLAIVGPVGGIGEPKRWPGCTAIWCMENIENEQAAVVGLFGFDSNREAACG